LGYPLNVRSIRSIAESGPHPSDQIAAPGKTENI
jgi:hypothetical protein